MIIRFSVENFRSFKNRQDFFLSAVKTCKEWQEENTCEVAGVRLLKSAVIYGANASGKTNLFLAMERMRSFILCSTDMNKRANLLFMEPFMLSTDCRTKPEMFELQFLHEGKVYTYGFSLLAVANGVDEYVVEREWLLQNVKKREIVYFLRERRRNEAGAWESVISVDKHQMPMGCGLETRTRPDTLFFTVAAQFAEPVCQGLSEYFRSSLSIVSGLNHSAMNAFSRMRLTLNEDSAAAIKKFIHDADTGIKDIAISNDGQVMSLHDLYDGQSNAIGRLPLNFQFSESQGTCKLFDLSGGLVDTLEHGKVMVIDELDAKLHPTLVRRLVMLFNDTKSNPKNAQLIVNVQSPDLLAFKEYYPPRKRQIVRLRRDQFFFMEKDNYESTILTSLIEFRSQRGMSTRNDASFAKDYMQGLYGGIPFVRGLVGKEA